MCDRRITNGKMDNGKKYMVYLVNSQYSEHQPESWVCGGVLISHNLVLTSAACLTEVSHMYVIAGYKKYVSGKNIDKDNCTRTKKQKIVKIIIPKAFNGSTWMQYDVGLGVVEKSYSFLDISYRKNCSYEPGTIVINFNIRKEAIKSPVLALGWGATNARQPGMVADTNSEYLMQTRTIITNNTYCRKQFPENVEYLFLCTDDNPVVNTSINNSPRAVTKFVQRGRETTSSTTTTTTEGRYFKEMWRCHGMKFSSNDTPAECLDLDSSELRRRLLSSNDSISNGTSLDDINDKNKTFDGDELDISETISRKQGKQKGGSNFGKGGMNVQNEGKKIRKGVQNFQKGKTSGKGGMNFQKEAKTIGKGGKNFQKEGNNVGKDGNNLGGICQNDHGGPLISTGGPFEMVIGIALNSVYDKKYQCKGPFLYLSTARASNLIKCLQPKKYFPKNPKHCSNNYETMEYDVDWPTNTPAPYEEAPKSCENGKCEITELPALPIVEPIEPIPVQPIPVRPKTSFNMRFPYKRPNLNLKFIYSKPNFNMALFATRPTF